MIALDTNVLVRIITKDDVDQAEAAAELLSGSGPFWISGVVLLELGWVLKSAYGMSEPDVSRALHLVASFERCVLDDAERIRRALTLHASGLDLGDAFIIAAVPRGGCGRDVRSEDDREGIGACPRAGSSGEGLPRS